jgi:haloacetate dehalogenase
MIMLFEGFEKKIVAAAGAAINLVRGGSGPPVLLLHGYPQTHACWHRVAPMLAEHFTVVCSDLRGYGDSAKPPSDDEHLAYSKRVMAQDQVEVMQSLGFDKFAVVGHDRGGRVAHRMALDHPDKVTHLALLDVVPAQTIYAMINKERATEAWRFFFLIQPFDLPERLIGGDPKFYLEWTLNQWCGTPGALAGQAMREYQRCFNAATIHATCEDYRAGATIDLAHDEADKENNIGCPLLLMWGKSLDRNCDVLATWQNYAMNIYCHCFDCGHFLAEERPEETAVELINFLDGKGRTFRHEEQVT